MNKLTPFTYEDHDVRVLNVDGDPWFVLTDICRVLEHSNPTAAAAALDEDEKGLRIVETPGGSQRLTTVSESGMYALIMRSNKPQAKPFRRWVTSEVLPSIRRTGTYSITDQQREHQSNARIFQARALMELCQAAKGLIHPDHLEAKARIVLAQGMGEHAELTAGREPLYTQDFLREKNLSASNLRSVASAFGKRVKKAYMEAHGVEPQRYPLTVGNGQVRNVYAYTEADRALMDDVWHTHYDPQGVLA